ncbi:sigma-70 family RNA polymerase sigma factor [Pseudonocardia eucalypti]|uniref:Sigma-70 family RNA polymerase sigma factor n=1 Tax=Pseudonocardia eucalypti TaxID=648755 RepID=A0ABP9QR02_9PSEU|nr:RNA polymerase sigma-70 factor (ECF subfamily) [Pseudonocardia eucalypti]
MDGTRRGRTGDARARRVGGSASRAPELRAVSGEAYPDWESVYLDNVDWVYRLMFAKLGNRADAEDLTAEVFLAALRPLRVSATVGEVRAYLTATARTVLAEHWRHTLGREVTVVTEGWDGPGADEEAESTATATRVALAEEILAALPDQYRRILRLRFLEGCSVREAAAELGVSVSNAKVLQHRALRRAAQLSGEVSR